MALAQFAGKSRPLTPAGIDAAAALLSVGPAEIWTVIQVETSGCGFLADRRPQILYERHYFHRLTGGRFDDGDISDPSAGGYGPTGANQYERLARAIALDRSAALQSTSWGVGQLMGANCAQAGFADVESMVAAMVDAEDAQVMAVSSFIAKSQMAAALKAHDWVRFASLYNGPDYVKNQYDTKLSTAFQNYQPSMNLTLRAAQLYLTFAGFNTGGIDGVAGSRTKTAVMAFQTQHGLAPTGIVDDSLLALLENALEVVT
jgi:hypothetical protein